MHPTIRVIRFCKRLFTEHKTKNHFQIRYWRGIFLSYPYPARPGYGTRGEFVGIYSIETPKEWIIDDLMSILLSDTTVKNTLENWSKI